MPQKTKAPDATATDRSETLAARHRVERLLKHATIQRGLLALLIVTGTMFSLWAVLRLHEVSDLEIQVNTLDSELSNLIHKLESQDEAMRMRLDTLERVLFGDVVTKLKPPPPAVSVPGWMQKRNQELQERILTLERWRLRVDKDLRDAK